MIQSIDQIGTFGPSNDRYYRVAGLSESNQGIIGNSIISSKKSSFQIENPILNSQVKIIKTNSWDIQNVNDFYFSNENNQLIVPDNFYEINEKDTVK